MGILLSQSFKRHRNSKRGIKNNGLNEVFKKPKMKSTAVHRQFLE